MQGWVHQEEEIRHRRVCVETVPSLWLHRGHGHNIDGIVGVEQGGAEVRDLRSRSEWEQRAELRQLHYQGP